MLVSVGSFQLCLQEDFYVVYTVAFVEFVPFQNLLTGGFLLQSELGRKESL